MAATYKTKPVLTVAPDFKSLDLGQLDDFSFDPQGLGRATPWKQTTAPKRRVTYPFLFRDRAASKLWRVFVENRRGRLTGFWLPLYTNDYPITQDQAEGDGTITIEKMGFSQKWAYGTQFRHLALLTRDGKLECYGVTAVTISGETEVLTLDDTLGTALVAADTVCCGLMFARFAEDEIAYEYKNDECCRAEVGFLELPTETLTPDFGAGPIGDTHSGSLPLYLYSIIRGGTEWLFTNWPQDVTTTDLAQWTAADITHGEIESGLDLIAESLEIVIATRAADHPLRALLDRNDLAVTEIYVYESAADTLVYDEAAPIYTGRVAACSFEPQGVIRLTLGSILRLVEQETPRIQLQRPCNHRLFDTFCGLDPAAFTTAGTVSAVSTDPAYVDASAFGAKATAEGDANWFALGRVVIGQQHRLCTGQSGDRLFLNAPFKDVATGMDVSARAGCDKRIGTCLSKFDNVDHHLGFTYTPNKNPQFEALSTPKPSGGKKS